MKIYKKSNICHCGNKVTTDLEVNLGLGGKGRVDQGTKATIRLCDSCLELEREQEAGRYGGKRQTRGSGFYSRSRGI